MLMADGDCLRVDNTRTRIRALEKYCTVEASVELGWFRAEVCRYDITENFFSNALWDVYILDYSLTPRPSTRATYCDRWSERPLEHIGQLLLLPPGFALSASGPARSYRALHCEIDAKAFEAIGWRPNWTDEALRDGLHLRNSAAERVMIRLATELQQNGLASDEIREALARLVCIEIARHFCRLSEQRSLRSGGLAPWRLRLIEERVWDATRPVPSVSELAQLCSLTERHIGRAFRVESGKTIGDYISDAAIERARSMLANTDLTIAAIARSVGYTCAGSFSESFLKRTGVRPSNVRAQSHSAKYSMAESPASAPMRSR